MVYDEAHVLFQAMDIDQNGTISREEFSLAPFDPVARQVAEIGVASSPAGATFWAPLLEVMSAVMRSAYAGFSDSRDSIESMLDTLKEPLAKAVARELQGVTALHDPEHQAQASEFAREILELCDVDELGKTMRCPAHVLELMVELEDEITGDVLTFLRAVMVARVLKYLKLSDGAGDECKEAIKCIEGVLMSDDNHVREMALHPDHILRMLIQKGSQSPEILRTLGRTVFQERLHTWLCERFMSEEHPLSKELRQKALIVAGAVVHGIDAELAELLVKVLFTADTPDDSDPYSSINRISNGMKLMTYLLPPLHEEGAHVFKIVLAQMCTDILSTLGMDEHACQENLKHVPWTELWASMKEACTTPPRPAAVMIGLLLTCLQNSEWCQKEESVKEEFVKQAKSRANEHLSTLVFPRLLLQWGLLPDNETKRFLNFLTESLLKSMDIKALSALLIDPSYLRTAFITQMQVTLQEHIGQPESTEKLTASETREIINRVVSHLLRRWLREQDIEDEDVDELMSIITKSGKDLVLHFTDPLVIGRKLLCMWEEDRNERNKTVIYKCALAILGRHLAEELKARGFDERATWLVAEALEDVPVEKLKSFLQQPRAFVVQMMREAETGGADVARQMLSEVESSLREALVAGLMNLGVEQECAETVAERTEDWLLNPEEALENMVEASSEHTAEEAVQRLRDEISSISGATVLSVALFFLKDRFVPAADMVLDAQVAIEMCDPAPSQGFLSFGACQFHGGDLGVEVFFWLVVCFSLLVWLVLYGAVVMHWIDDIRSTVVELVWTEQGDQPVEERVITNINEALLHGLDKWPFVTGICYLSIFFTISLTLGITFGLPTVLIFAPLLCYLRCDINNRAWSACFVAAKNFLSQIFFAVLRVAAWALQLEDGQDATDLLAGLKHLSAAWKVLFMATFFILQMVIGLPAAVLGLFVWLCSSLWSRVYACVRMCVEARRGSGRYHVLGSVPLAVKASGRAFQLVVLAWLSPTVPIGMAVLIVVELYSIFLSPHQQLQSDFGSRYENLKRVLEPVGEALPQSLVQTSYMIYMVVWKQGKFDYMVLLSVVTSLVQVYSVYYYVEELSKMYRIGTLAVAQEMLALGSRDKVPFRLVLLKWPAVDYSLLARNDLLDPDTTEYFKQIGNALAGNAVLKKLRFAVRQLSPAKIDVLKAAMEANKDLVELHFAEDRDADIVKSIPFLPGINVRELLKSCSHLQVVHMEGLESGYDIFKGLGRVLGSMRNLKDLRLSFQRQDPRGNDTPMPMHTLRDIQSDSASYFKSVRILERFELRCAPAGVVWALMPGLCGNRSITHLDLSENALQLVSLRSLAGWIRKGRLLVVILHCVRIVKDDCKLANALAALHLLTTLKHQQSRVQVLNLMIHPAHAAGLGMSGVRQLAGASRRSVRKAKTTMFVSVGVLTSESISGPASSQALRRSRFDDLMDAIRAGYNMLVPCFPWNRTTPRSVMLRHRAEADGKQRIAETAYRICEQLHRDKSAVVLCLMLRRVPAGLARDMRVLLQDVVGGQDALGKIKEGSVRQNLAHGLQMHQNVILDSCGITDVDMKDWSAFIACCSRLVLQDNPIAHRGLALLRKSLKRNSSTWFIPVMGRGKCKVTPAPMKRGESVASTTESSGDSPGGVIYKGSARLRDLEFVMATPVTAAMFLNLAGIANDSNRKQPHFTGITCSIKNGYILDSESDWVFFPEHVRANYDGAVDDIFGLMQQRQMSRALDHIERRKLDFDSQDAKALRFLFSNSSMWKTRTLTNQADHVPKNEGGAMIFLQFVGLSDMQHLNMRYRSAALGVPGLC